MATIATPGYGFDITSILQPLSVDTKSIATVELKPSTLWVSESETGPQWEPRLDASNARFSWGN